MKPIKKLILVYNAENGAFNAIASTLHRVFSPSTYECSLCFYTYDIRGMSLKWKNFLGALGCQLEFYYRTEFRTANPQIACELPAIFIEDENELTLLLSAEKIRGSGDVDGLIQNVLAKLEVMASFPANQEPGLPLLNLDSLENRASAAQQAAEPRSNS